QVPNDPGVVSPRPFLLEPVPQPGLLGCRGGDGERAPLDQARVDTLGRADPGHLVDRVTEVLLEVADTVRAPRVPGVARPRPGQLSRHPAAVPAGGAVPGEAGLEHDDPERGVGAAEVVGGPQAGITRADDAHIGFGAARQRGPPRRDATCLPPIRHLPVTHDSPSRNPFQRGPRSTAQPAFSAIRRVASRYATWGA